MLSIQIGLNGRFFPNNWRSVHHEIAFAREFGFVAIQFPGPEDGLQAERVGENLEKTGELLQQAGVTAVMEMVGRMTPTGRTADGRTPLDILHANLPAILALGCTCVHWHLVPAENMDETKQLNLETAVGPQLAHGVVLAQKHGFRLGLEHNAAGIPLFATPESCKTLISAVPGLGFVWDFNHTIPDHLLAFRALAAHASMLHISDTPLPAVNYHWPLGRGIVDVVGNCRALAQAGFVGPAILEIGGAPWSGGFGQDSDEALIESLQCLQQAVETAVTR